MGCWGILESRLGVFFRSLSITFCLNVVLRLSLVLWTKSVNTCLSLSNSVQFFVSCVISVLIRAEFSSILLTSSLLVLIAAESRESATSFSAFHHAWLPTGHAFDLHCCVCVPMQMFFHSRNAVKIAIGSSHFFDILMGARVQSSCFCIQWGTGCSLPSAPGLSEVVGSEPDQTVSLSIVPTAP